MHWVDSHIHLSSYQALDRETLLKNSLDKNIKSWVMAGYSADDWQLQNAMVEPNVFKSFGLHPWHVLASSAAQVEKELSLLESLLPHAHALGETGLDAFRSKSDQDMDRQMHVFQRHLLLNRAHPKPLVLHIVQAHEKALGELKKYDYCGLVHGFSGSWETAKSYIDLGYKISVGRGVYHKGYKSLKETVQKLPLTDLLIESDAFMDPQDGPKKEPEDAVEIYFKVVEAVCALKNISQQQLQEATFRNINTLFTKE